MTGPESRHTTWSASYWDDDDPWIFEDEARDYVARLQATLPLGPTARVLDFGCGFGFVPRLLAPHVATIAVGDASPAMRRRARATLADVDNVAFVDLASAPPPTSGFDWILVNSVIQYMTRDDLASWLRQWHQALAPDGRLVISDVWPPHTRFVAELATVVAFAIRRRILLKALVGGLRRGMRHRTLERAQPLLRLEPAALARMAVEAGFRVTPLAENLTYRRGRFSVVLSTR